jgi:hypothetical protein
VRQKARFVKLLATIRKFSPIGYRIYGLGLDPLEWIRDTQGRKKRGWNKSHGVRRENRALQKRQNSGVRIGVDRSGFGIQILTIRCLKGGIDKKEKGV